MSDNRKRNTSTAKTVLRGPVKKRARAPKADSQPPLSVKGKRKIVHKPDTRQIKLEMQIAELGQARLELEASLNKYIELYDHAPVGYFTFDTKGRIGQVNLSGAKLLERERQSLTNKPFSGFIADKDGKGVFAKHCKDVLQKKGSRTCEIRLKRKGNAPFWGQMQSIAKESINGRSGNIFTAIIDITGHKKIEQTLYENEQRLNRTQEIAHFGSWELDLITNRLTCSDEVYRIWGLHRPDQNDNLTCQAFLDALHPDDRAAVDAAYSDSVSEDRDTYKMEHRVVRGSTGEVRIVQEKCKHIRDASGKIIRSIGSVHDITECKEAEDALQKANEELKKRIEEQALELQGILAEVEAMKDQFDTENIYIRHKHKIKHQFEDIIGESDAIKYILYRAEQVAKVNTTVLILGETGTGKELIANAIHHLSPRKERPLITVNCAALPANLIESELFGREKGAFTGADALQKGRFEIANDSTLCLDEIGELPLDLQGKLLRVIQHNRFERLGSSRTVEVNVRIIATTNRDLAEEVRRGRFRQDLYYRLNVFPITVPPLRQRKEDIPLMVQAFVDQYSRTLGKHITSISKETMAALQDYPWPGNVRELESVIERAVILCHGPVLQLADSLTISSSPLSSNLRTLEETERKQILKILSETRWRIEGKNGAAAILGIHPSTLRARMHKLGIVRPQIK